MNFPFRFDYFSFQRAVLLLILYHALFIKWQVIDALSELPSDLTLLPLIDSSLDDSESDEALWLLRLARVLTRIEDCSHILVWGSPKAQDAQSKKEERDGRTVHRSYQVRVVELPRLKMKFQPIRRPDGQVHLHLLDHAGWFISDLSLEADGVKEERAEFGLTFLSALINRIDNCLILENQSHELQVRG